MAHCVYCRWPDAELDALMSRALRLTCKSRSKTEETTSRQQGKDLVDKQSCEKPYLSMCEGQSSFLRGVLSKESATAQHMVPIHPLDTATKPIIVCLLDISSWAKSGEGVRPRALVAPPDVTRIDAVAL